MKKVVRGALIAAAVAGVVRFWPDIVRYIKIRSM